MPLRYINRIIAKDEDIAALWKKHINTNPHVTKAVIETFGGVGKSLMSNEIASTEVNPSLSSAVRLGVGLGLIQDVGVGVLNEMMVETQPAHLQKLRGTLLDTADRNAERAHYLQKHLRSGEDPVENN